MTLLPSTMALLLCLLMATLLGAGIGACIWHLRLARRQDRALQHLRRSGAREREALAAMLSRERETFVLKHEQQTRRLRQEHERAERATLQADELAGRESEQLRRIAELEAGAAAPQAHSSALRGRRVGADRDAPSSEPPSRWPHEPGQERLPVLSRRVDSATPSPGDDVPVLDGELEIPMLAESELPDSVDDLLFELFDTGRAGAVATHGGSSRAADPDVADPNLARLDIGGPAGEPGER